MSSLIKAPNKQDRKQFPQKASQNAWVLDMWFNSFSTQKEAAS
jgi:hypothetical protein